MRHLTNADLLYPIFMIIFSIVMILSPRSLMRNAKYDEDSLKTESWVKKLGILMIVLAVGLGIYMIYKLNNA